jgi:hypothetical protein
MDSWLFLSLLPLLAMAAIVERTKKSVPYLAKEWGVSTKKITAFIKSGELKAINIATSPEQRPRYLIDQADIETFERSRQVVPDGGESPTRKLRRRAAGNIKEFF